jgi:spermidine synthase
MTLRQFPTPLLPHGKVLPMSRYTSKRLMAGATVASQHLEAKPGSYHQITADGVLLKSINANYNFTTLEEEEEEEIHLPAGQHLLVDIRNVDPEFLDSESLLAKAMLDIVAESQLTLLSYHCHSVAVPAGVACVGVLLESHIFVRTWPLAGVLVLDLFTCGSGKLVPVMPSIEKLFAIPRTPKDEDDLVEQPLIRWGHKLRGFRNHEAKDFLSKDMGRFILSDMGYTIKQEIVGTDTSFQRVDIYDLVHPSLTDHTSHVHSLSHDDTHPSYESTHSNLFQQNRAVFIDGIMQSSRYDHEIYHEALVQPAMFSHPNPKRVAVIGGGEGAVLREVLKHKSVQSVEMIEIDRDLVNLAREYLPEWSDCTDLHSAKWCGQDKRANVYYEDAFAWFNHRFGNNHNHETAEQKFDVLVVDALAPKSDTSLALMLNNENLFFNLLYNSLSDDGVITLQLGQSPAPIVHNQKSQLVDALQAIGFESIHIYEESHCGFGGNPWRFVVAMKNKANDNLWYQRNGNLVDLEIPERILKTVSGDPALKYFDSATMRTYYSSSYTHQGEDVTTAIDTIEKAKKRLKTS